MGWGIDLIESGWIGLDLVVIKSTKKGSSRKKTILERKRERDFHLLTPPFLFFFFPTVCFI